MNLIEISEREFRIAAAAENCRSYIDEIYDAQFPIFGRAAAPSSALLHQKTLSLWRIDPLQEKGVFDFNVPKIRAIALPFQELASKSWLFSSVEFDSTKDYFRTNRVIAFRCSSCEVRLIKDGNHRLLQCALRNEVHELEVYEAVSGNWSASTVDMKNFCQC